MKKQNGIKKLNLNRETLRALSPSDLARAEGALGPLLPEQGASDTCVRYFTGYPCDPIYCA